MSDVILYKEDIDRLNSILQSLVGETKILSALLVNKDTRLLAHQGMLAMYDMSALAALIVGSFSSTQAIAGLIGEHEFSTMSHCGKTKNLLISLVDDNTIIATIFDRAIPISAVTASIERHTGMLQQALAAITHNMETLFQGPVAMPALTQDDVEQGIDSFFEQAPSHGAAPSPVPETQQAAAFEPVAQEPHPRGRTGQRIIAPPPETKHIQYEPVQAQEQPIQPHPAPQEEVLASSMPDRNATHYNGSSAMRKIPPPSNTEYLYFTSMNYLKNKAKEASSFQKTRNEKGIFSRFFNRGKRNP